VVALIGDGSIGSGMALEALNHIGSLGKPLLVLLNDNRMSIARTVGALANYLSVLRAAPLYNELKREVRSLLDALPMVGHPMESALEFLKDTARHALVPGRMFEDLGFRYFGPVDGHDLDVLIDTLSELQRLSSEKPLLLHVLTEKGRGFTPATQDPTTFHSSPPFETGDGDVFPRLRRGARSYTDAFADALIDLARRDRRVVAITAAMPTGTGLTRFARAFPTRFYDVGICEQHAVGLASGLARGGLRPVVAIYSTFCQRACDQVFHDLCLQRVPVVLALDRAGLVGGDGPTHQGLYDIGWLRPFPGLVLAAPRDGDELAELLAWALSQAGPVAIRYPKAPLPEDLFSTPPSPLGQGCAEVLAEGKDAALLAYGAAVEHAERARRLLVEKGAATGLVNARFAKPLDEETVGKLLAETRLVVTIEDGVLAGGFGSAVAELAARCGRRSAELLQLGVPGEVRGQGTREELLEQAGLDAAGIARQVGEALEPSRARKRSSKKKSVI
jgi:1-deoxy-D-xylulose-5-phosphate synthase